jgi:Flp pilus assembly protein protease CpaA
MLIAPLVLPLHLMVLTMQMEDMLRLAVPQEVVVVVLLPLFVLPMPLFSCRLRNLKLRSGAEGGPGAGEIVGMLRGDLSLQF